MFQNVRNLLRDAFNGATSPDFFSGDLLFVSNEDECQVELSDDYSTKLFFMDNEWYE